MDNTNAVSSPLTTHFKLNTKQCPSTDEKKKEIEKVPYASTVGNLMYAMVYMRLNIAHPANIVS